MNRSLETFLNFRPLWWFCSIVGSFLYDKYVLDNSLLNLILLLFFVLIIGLPHGSLDYNIIKKNFPNGYTKIVIIYFFVFLFTIISWYLLPLLSLVILLVLSAYHFGGDYSQKILTRIVIGSIIIFLPIFFKSQESFFLLSILVEKKIFFSNLQMIIFLSLLILALIYFSPKLKRRNTIFIDILIFAILSFILDPIIYFLVYFCFYHSIHHFCEISSDLRTNSFWSLYKKSIPTSLITVLLGLIFYIYFLESLSYEESITITIFVGLLSLTVPHMILIEFNKKFKFKES